MERKEGLTTWRKASTSSLALIGETWNHIVSVGKSGAMFGQGVRTLHPPRSTVGVLVFWKHGDAQLHCDEKDHGYVDRPAVLCVRLLLRVPTVRAGSSSESSSLRGLRRCQYEGGEQRGRQYDHWSLETFRLPARMLQ